MERLDPGVLSKSIGREPVPQAQLIGSVNAITPAKDPQLRISHERKRNPCSQD
jgi:hypothetical protein